MDMSSVSVLNMTIVRKGMATNGNYDYDQGYVLQQI